jgi:transcriptional regulator with XRE-family HTH domain
LKPRTPSKEVGASFWEVPFLRGDKKMLKCDYSDTVRGAAEQNGGYRRLAERLGVTEADLMNWTSGYSAPTTETLLRLVSIFLEYTPASREKQWCSGAGLSRVAAADEGSYDE